MENVPDPASKDADAPSRSMPPPLPPLSTARGSFGELQRLEYFRPVPLNGVILTRCKTVGEWFAIKRLLNQVNINPMMGDGLDSKPADGDQDPGIAMLISQEFLAPAQAIVEEYRSGRQRCPHCGSFSVENVSPRWYWYILAILFLGLPPFWPASKVCKSCGKKWG
jgi:hypothetical protein